MRIVLVSDSHGDRECLKWLKKTYADYDAFVHCGDLQIPHEEAEGYLAVRGNTDWDQQYPWGRIEEFAGNRVLIVHGHMYLNPFDRTDMMPLAMAAKKNGCTAVFFGHTHVSLDTVCEGIHILNPGSIRRPKDFQFFYPTYMLVNADESGIQAVRMVYQPEIKG